HRVDQRDDRSAKLLRQPHQSQRLSVTLRVGHAEVAAEYLLGIAAPLMTDDHHRLAVEPRPAGDDRRIFTKEAIAVQLDEVGEDQLEIIERERSLRLARDLDALPWREIPVDLGAQIGQLLLERLDLVGDAELAVAGELP